MARLGSEQDLLSKLGRALDEGSLHTLDETSTANDLINRLGVEIEHVAEDDDHTLRTPSQFDDDDYGDFEDESHHGHGGAGGGAGGCGEHVQMFDRPTPYEVWKAKQQEDQSHLPGFREKKGSSRLKNKEWDSLVSHLHSSNKYKYSIILKTQQENIADEFRQWTFKPQLADRSRQMAENTAPLLERQDLIRERHEERMEEQRQIHEEEELAECTFRPDTTLSSARTNSSMTQHRTAEDMSREWQEIQERREARKAVLTAIEQREYSFAPSLNRKSLMLSKKMTADGRRTVDRTSGQTTVVPRSRSNSKSGTKAFRPEVSQRAFRREGDMEDVHDRLYTSGKEQNIRRANAQISAMRGMLRDLNLKPWEQEERDPSTSAAWVQTNNRGTPGAGGGVGQETDIAGAEDLLVDENDPAARVETFSTMEYSRGLDFILENINEVWLAKSKAEAGM